MNRVKEASLRLIPFKGKTHEGRKAEESLEEKKTHKKTRAICVITVESNVSVAHIRTMQPSPALELALSTYYPSSPAPSLITRRWSTQPHLERPHLNSLLLI
jgi:hypothetical protein